LLKSLNGNSTNGKNSSWCLPLWASGFAFQATTGQVALCAWGFNLRATTLQVDPTGWESKFHSIQKILRRNQRLILYNAQKREGGDAMKKIIFLTVLFLISPGLICHVSGQSPEDLEKEGLKYFDNAFFRSVNQKGKAKSNVEFAHAEKAFKKAIEKNPNRVEPYLHLGRTFFVQKKYLQAAQVYRTALTIAPQKKKIYLKLASALEMAEDFEGAISALEELRHQETDPRVIQLLNDFISKIEKRVENIHQNRP
jgi:cytochrome c-type biogenesis protein CcmH/NrfG